MDVIGVLTCNLKVLAESSLLSPASRVPRLESWRRRDDGAFLLPLKGAVDTGFQLCSVSALFL